MITADLRRPVERARAGDWEDLLSLRDPRADWQAAPCVADDPDLFFGDELATVQAIALCRKCPARTRATCLITALEEDSDFGVRGGTTPGDRRDLHELWRRRVDEENVRAALAGRPVPLTEAEERRAVQLYARSSVPTPRRVARGLGISVPLLRTRARRGRLRDTGDTETPGRRPAA
ncbi:WhiB family transcriptional regulator [Streptomyces sp. AJS327]|uniref:WhiB family transcriptional regulator n=1 Tax=Streptomyces sp. AJS327 TaxID=2545265 RepID=UPI0015DE4B8E|nr:WhiB family transcriptional regulator [Streptomyces sp. AJS327]